MFYINFPIEHVKQYRNTYTGYAGNAISNPNRQRIKYQIGKKMFSINMKLFFEKKKNKGHVRVCNTDVLKYTHIKYIIEVNAH